MSKLKNDELDSLITPNYMWVTFKYTKAKDKCLEEDMSFKIKDTEVQFERA